ncbi:MAG: hypothetical protein HY695_13030 [Deltaproteobacteria bacterium]|nr:hypothetical protein [Deltaproteobacteria bacterium]
MTPTAEDFKRELEMILGSSGQEGKRYVDVKAGDLHRRVGGYPGPNNRMPVCCQVMKGRMQKGDEVLDQPPSGQGASLTIRYHLSKPVTDQVPDHPELKINAEIYEQLKEVATRKSTTTYGEIAPLIGLDMTEAADRNRLGNLLGEISTLEHRNGRPLLSVVVVHRDNNMPGNGFFKLARRLGAYTGRDDFEFFIHELKRVHDHWAATKSVETSDPVPVKEGEGIQPTGTTQDAQAERNDRGRWNRFFTYLANVWRAVRGKT